VGLGSECAAGGFVVFVYRHCVCCVWDSLVWVWGVSVQQVALWYLYIGNVWLCVEVIKCLLFYEPLILYECILGYL